MKVVCSHANKCNIMPYCPHQVQHEPIGDCETQGECPDVTDERVMCIPHSPNRVVVEIKGGVIVDVRAERPSEIVVIIYDKDDDDGGCEVPVEQLNCVKEVTEDV